MASNRTEFLGLNDWIGTDAVRREEINDNFRKLDGNASDTSDKIGDLLQLQTTAKGSLVSAVNENKSQLADDGEKINDLRSVQKIQPVQSKVIGHRGNYYAPEETLPTIGLAYKNGYLGVECDPRLTSDGQFVLMHDETVDRMTDGSGSVNSLTLAQIKAFNIDAGTNIAYYTGLKVPTLEEWIVECKKYGMVSVCHSLLISGYSDQFLDIIRKYDMENNVIVLTDLPTCQELRSKSNKLTLFMITFNNLNNADIDIAKANGVGLSYYSDTMAIDSAYQASVRYAYQNGVKLNAWVENNILRVNQLKDLGIHYITTDMVTDTDKVDFETMGVKHTEETTVVSKYDYQNVMSAPLKVENQSVPTTDGYYYDATNNIMHFYSSSGKQGFACIKPIGNVKKGDIIEIFAKVNVKSGVFKTLYDTSAKTGNESVTHDLGEQLIHRIFVVHYDDASFSVSLGAGTNDAGEYSITDGILIKVTSMRNKVTTYVDKLRCMIVTDSGTLPQRFTYYTGDTCTITQANTYGIYVTFDRTLKQRGITLATVDVGGGKYIIQSGYSTANRAYLEFIDPTTGNHVALSSLPATMYVNLALF